MRENTPLTSISDPSALVEYLNNINLKGDMVLDELKRVSSDRDSFKQKFAEAEKKAKEAWDEVASLHNSEANGTPKDVAKSVPAPEEAQPKEIVNGDPLGVSSQSPTTSTKSRKGSLASLSIFSPKTKPLESPVLEKKSEDLFSFDNELPRLEAEIKEKQATIEGLEGEVNALRGDLAVTRESTQSMAGSLEKSTRELNILRERKDQLESELKEQASNSQKEIKQVKADLQTVECQLHDLKTETQSRDTAMVESLTKQLDEAKTEIKRLATRPTSEDHDFRAKELQARVEDLEAKITNLHADARLSEKRVETLNGLVSNLRGQLQSSDEASNQIQNDCRNRIAQYEAKLVNAHVNGITVADDKPLISDKSGIPQVVEPTVEPNAASKKRNKKKKKGGKSTVDSSAEDPPGGTVDKQSDDGAKELREIKESAVSNDAFVRVQNELDQLRLILAEKDAAIEKIQRKLKDQDDLKEEIESLRDDLVTVGQEHVEAKDRAKDLLAEKKALQSTIADLEMQLAELKSTHTSITAGSEAKHNELVEQFEDLKRKASSLQTDLSAAEQLANTRFKDITELKSILQKAQPELASLRAESAELRNVRESLNQKIYEIRRLDDRQEEMQLDLTKLKRAENELEKENKALNEKIAQESTGRLKAEEAGSNLTQQVHDLTVEKRHATESIDRLSRELAKAKEELRMSRTRLQDLEQQLSKTRAENEGFKEETELKTAQYASAQSLMTSMRDQTTEMATQMKEARERCESLDEEVAEAHKLLSERTREAETMRRLLADVEGRADARTREMKERMDTAIEERDRAEDEASTAGRRRAREMEEMRNKVREVERNLKRVEDEKEELESAQRDWKRRREDLEYRSDQSTKEVEAVRKAMSELRDALDESEKQVRDAEKQKAELKRAVEETQQRLEKLQKSNKVIFLLSQIIFSKTITNFRCFPVHGRRCPHPPNSEDKGGRLRSTVVKDVNGFRTNWIAARLARPKEPSDSWHDEGVSQRASAGLNGLRVPQECAPAIFGAEG